jgi:hypothetical protein
MKSELKKTSSKDIRMEFSLEKCARVSLESHKVHRRQHTGNTMVNGSEELRGHERICI